MAEGTVDSDVSASDTHWGQRHVETTAGAGVGGSWRQCAARCPQAMPER